MKIYLVGGAVRDKLLGLPVKERDYVVVGATEADMLKLGYRQVGKEFPVFLHPKSGEEYALARTEFKIGPGYTGFAFHSSPELSLENDLVRRDLTINAMGEDIETGELIDPYCGKSDIDKKILRHVSPAFAEDPVRILRVGRFLARYTYLGFHVAPETIQLMKKMVANGEVDALVAERVWKELERALGEKNPEKFFAVLHECGALAVLFPNLDPQGMGIKALQEAVKLKMNSIIRFSALVYHWPEVGLKNLCQRYKLPNAYKDLAVLTVRYYKTALKVEELSADELMGLFAGMDLFRRKDRFRDFVRVCEAIAKAGGGKFNRELLVGSAEAALGFDVQILIGQGLKNNALAQGLREKRTERVGEFLKNRNQDI